MNKLTIESDDGFLHLDLPGGGVVRLDVYIASERFAKAINDGGTSSTDQATKLAEAMLEYSIPAMSYMNHFRIFNRCKQLAEEGQKKEGLTQPAQDGLGSPGTTDSVPTN